MFSLNGRTHLRVVALGDFTTGIPDAHTWGDSAFPLGLRRACGGRPNRLAVSRVPWNNNTFEHSSTMFFLQAARWPPCSLLACKYISCSGIASDTDILAVGINGVECCAQRSVHGAMCGKRKTDSLFELAACLEKSWVKRGCRSWLITPCRTVCLDLCMGVHPLRHLSDTKQQQWQDFGTEPDW